MTVFRPCIDLHQGKVKQIVGSTLDSGDTPQVNFEARHPATWFSQLYKKDGLRGGHVIMLGPGNDITARQALTTYPGGLQIGGGIHLENALQWLEAGAEKVIVTSWLFPDGRFSIERLKQISQKVGKEQLVVDLSCKRSGNGWRVAFHKWTKLADSVITRDFLQTLAPWCSEILIHAADVEGKCEGIDQKLVEFLGNESPISCTYAGGAKNIDDLELVKDLSGGHLDLTIGSALDIFGGNGARYDECVEFNRKQTGH